MRELKKRLSHIDVDAIVFPIRGGATMAHFLAEGLKIKSVYALNVHSYDETTKVGKPIISNMPNISHIHKNILIVDEIVDSGETMHFIMDALKTIHPNTKFLSATIFQKDSAIFKSDFYARKCDDWIEFFWEKDLLQD